MLKNRIRRDDLVTRNADGHYERLHYRDCFALNGPNDVRLDHLGGGREGGRGWFLLIEEKRQRDAFNRVYRSPYRSGHDSALGTLEIDRFADFYPASFTDRFEIHSINEFDLIKHRLRACRVGVGSILSRFVSCKSSLGSPPFGSDFFLFFFIWFSFFSPASFRDIFLKLMKLQWELTRKRFNDLKSSFVFRLVKSSHAIFTTSAMVTSNSKNSALYFGYIPHSFYTP